MFNNWAKKMVVLIDFPAVNILPFANHCQAHLSCSVAQNFVGLPFIKNSSSCRGVGHTTETATNLWAPDAVDMATWFQNVSNVSNLFCQS